MKTHANPKNISSATSSLLDIANNKTNPKIKDYIIYSLASVNPKAANNPTLIKNAVTSTQHIITQATQNCAQEVLHIIQANNDENEDFNHQELKYTLTHDNINFPTLSPHNAQEYTFLLDDIYAMLDDENHPLTITAKLLRNTCNLYDLYISSNSTTIGKLIIANVNLLNDAFRK